MGKLEQLIRSEVHMNGVGLLAAIAHEEGLAYPTAEMQELMDKRNEAIMRSLDGEIGAEKRARTIRSANQEYLASIEAAARAAASVEGSSGSGQGTLGGNVARDADSEG